MPTPENFPLLLRPHVERLGAVRAAKVCGVTRQTIYAWLRGGGNPNAATVEGCISLLAKEEAEAPDAPQAGQISTQAQSDATT